MSTSQRPLPSAGGPLYLTDGGMETTLIFRQGFDLPEFSSLVMMTTPDKRAAVADYAETYFDIARKAGLGMVIETATWRASPDWTTRIGFHGLGDLADANRQAVELLADVRGKARYEAVDIIISGCIGPRGDGYDAGSIMSADEAEAYHAWQVGILSETSADVISGLTMTNIAEAIGLARAAKAAGCRSVISFTVETDGRLPTGDTLARAIAEVDAATHHAPAYYMVNCAHPIHLAGSLDLPAGLRQRLRGIRANASKCSHAELDAMETLDDGDPLELGGEMATICAANSNLRVFGGCCGTDDRHIAAMAVELRRLTAGGATAPAAPAA
ncbi:MAG: homocysteine S-methyltransferase family protein [Pseudomonadota bacterium]